MEMTPTMAVVLHAAAVVVFCAAVLFITHFLPKPWRRNVAKETPYESGMDPVGDAHQHLDVRFCIVAVLFLVFDVELLFLYPWAVCAFPVDGSPAAAAGALPAIDRGPAFVVLAVFVATLVLGYAYAWKKGVFEWR